MKSFEFEQWDSDRLTVNRRWAEIFKSNNVCTFDSLMQFEGGTVAKNLLKERTTTRIELPEGNGVQEAFYIKRHTRPPLKEFVKPWLRLTRPILGARNEWEAMLRFHSVGIPTMIPVVLGEAGQNSFVVTKAIDGFTKLSHWMHAHCSSDNRPNFEADRRRGNRLIEAVANIARAMHEAGMHHQDFYLTHLLVPEDADSSDVHVIDLGRVGCRKRLSSRWIVKDLAQLDYSADLLTRSDRQRFLKTYLGRELRSEDRRLIRRVQRKSHSIARHSRKNRL